jgi:dihydrofolate reductase
MELTVTTFVTMNGVMQSPGGAQEDPSGGFVQGGWGAPYFDEATGARVAAWFGLAAELLLGRFTYETFKAFWPQVTDPGNVIAHAINTLPKHVVTRRGTDLDWTGARAVTGDVVEAVRDLKARDTGGELQVHGSAGLLRTLLAEADLVDEVRVLTFPVVTGPGKRLFEDATAPGAWRLTECSTTATGVVVTVYRPDGPVRSGGFEVHDGSDVVTT